MSKLHGANIAQFANVLQLTQLQEKADLAALHAKTLAGIFHFCQSAAMTEIRKSMIQDYTASIISKLTIISEEAQAMEADDGKKNIQ